jgi:NAD(P)-dependent dehydrogenase (short-subunit alcohol dehydrogenase family)
VVNNAGLSPVYDSLEDVSRVLFDKVMSVNIAAPFRLSAVMAPRMAAAGRGSIVNISSIASVRPRGGHLPYAVAKAGLNALTQGMAGMYGPAVRVNSIMAGPFATEMSKDWDPEATRRRVETYPLKRMGRPEEVVGAALYLASDASSFTTGAIIAVDGGVTVS